MKKTFSIEVDCPVCAEKCQRAIAADHDKGIYSMSLEILICLGTAFFAHETLASGCTKDCASTIDCTADTF